MSQALCESWEYVAELSLYLKVSPNSEKWTAWMHYDILVQKKNKRNNLISLKSLTLQKILNTINSLNESRPKPSVDSLEWNIRSL